MSNLSLSLSPPTSTSVQQYLYPTLSPPPSCPLTRASPIPSPRTFRLTALSSTGTHQAVVGAKQSSSKLGKQKNSASAGLNAKETVFFLDVKPLCYKGSSPSLTSFAHWISLFFSQVCRNCPVIAVFDGEGGHEFRRKILPSYKAHRMKFYRRANFEGLPQSPVGRSQQIIFDFLRSCNVPVLKIEGQEADDVIATLAGQVLDRGRVVIASPDKDFKQLISENVELVLPLPELGRWSFYTLKHYLTQYDCDPQSDLSLRCIIGDDADGVPGIQNLVPGFGRKTALKLVKKHGSLENLLNAAAVRTVAKPYAQDALTKYASELRRNYQVLALRRDVDVHFQDEWLSKRDRRNDKVAMLELHKSLEGG